MATKDQREAAKTNVKKAQEAWRSMSKTERARAQPEGDDRAPPGEGEGDYYHVRVRRKSDFKTFRTQDVGDPGHLQRVAGQRSSGSWDTVKWLVHKDDAHDEDGILVADTEDVQDLFDRLGSKPKHASKDRYDAKPRPNVPEKDKPTDAQKKARQENIKKAQEARHD